MTISCCSIEPVNDEDESVETESEFSSQRCKNCGGQGRPVSRKTVLLMVKPDFLEQAMTGTYSFCSARDCPVVYFEEEGRHSFSTDDLRTPVGVKTILDPIPLCYCFGFDVSDARAEIAATGRCLIPQRISALIKQGMCACPARNPSGACCLGEVNRSVQRLLTETSN